jgi:hypothetical protein
VALIKLPLACDENEKVAAATRASKKNPTREKKFKWGGRKLKREGEFKGDGELKGEGELKGGGELKGEGELEREVKRNRGRGKGREREGEGEHTRCHFYGDIYFLRVFPFFG